MKTLATFIAAAAFSVTTSGVAFADSAADFKVRSTISDNVIHGQTQPAVNYQHVAETGKSVAASRVEQSLNGESLKGQSSKVTSSSQSFVNDAGKSVSATRVQHALSESISLDVGKHC